MVNVWRRIVVNVILDGRELRVLSVRAMAVQIMESVTRIHTVSAIKDIPDPSAASNSAEHIIVRAMESV